MDDNLHRSILEKRLIALGLSVSMVTTRDALDMELSRGGDVLFIDQDVTQMDGKTLPTDLVDQGLRTPILILAPFTGGVARASRGGWSRAFWPNRSPGPI